MKNYNELIKDFKDVRIMNDELALARNHSLEFYRILRRKFNGQNANIETYGVRKDYKGIDVTLEYQKELLNKLKDPVFRFQPKNDHNKTNITDSPGFGSVRLAPPYENETFDREYFEFLNNIVDKEDDVYDFGGGMSPFLYFLSNGNKFLIDKANIPDVVEPLGIKYIDSDLWQLSKPENKLNNNSVIFCFHTLEHTDNPEKLIKLFSSAGVFVFSTPNEELINTSIYHHIFMQINIFKKLFELNNSIAFLRISKNAPLDIHGIVINSPQKWNYIKNNNFFNKNFKLYTEMY